MATAAADIQTTPTVMTATATMRPRLIARPFDADKPALWFAQLETQFADLGYVTESDKYNKTVPLIDTAYAAEVEHLIVSRPVTNPYQTLKNELIRCFTKSRTANIIQLLDRESIGDRTPSKHLRHLKSLVPGIDDEVLKTRWLSHLPEQTRATLATQENASIDDLAKLADRVHEVFHPNSVAAIITSAGNATNAALLERIEQLTATVAELRLKDSRSRSRTRSEYSRGQRNNSRRRCSSRKVLKKFDTCWYHHSYGENARNCQPGCSNVSVTPCRRPAKQKDTSGYQLFAANGTLINTYGYASISPDLGLRREFTWRFIEADVSRPIIGADFLHHYNLLPDLRNECLIDSSTGLKSTGRFTRFRVMSVKLLEINENSPYASILKEFPAITKPGGLLRKAEHSTVHHIRTTPGPPISCRARRLAPDKLKTAQAEFSSMLTLGTARRSESPWASALHLAPKGNNGWRPCGDYRTLNDRTIPDKYPVHYLEDFAANLYGKTIFSTIDLVKAFNQIPVAREDIQKTPIITPFGRFEFPYRTFGLRNAAQTFQRLIDEVTRDLPFLFPYIDDILVASEDAEQHREHLRILFQRLQDYGLIINVAKSVLGQPEVLFLGHVINAQGIKPPKDRVNAILEFTRPTTVKSLRRYLGTLNFYRKFIKGAAEILAPLNAATQGTNVKGRQPVAWSPALEEAFTRSKQALAEATLLSHPNIEAERLDYIAQFSTDIRYVAGPDNVVADALSRVEKITTAVTPQQLVDAQRDDQELRQLLQRPDVNLRLDRLQLPGMDEPLYCDVSSGTVRPYVPAPLRQQFCSSLHSMAHPGPKGTRKLVTQRYVWPGINKDCPQWTKHCLECQKNKITRHAVTPTANIETPSR
ncbi:uncharacterized protein K02A2.6-like [Diachasma alloeum]|uniref:uncharacterized protein K02A2.6-like n=1 Tax=Diachasma alloeum TaxID=454923 RepID=UPI0007382064|nr:uncharacterized protein K02A2.6-like [Diachasma alloeum]